MTLASYEYSYNGYVFGGGNLAGVLSVEGLDSVDPRVASQPKMGDHGGYAHAQYLDLRTIVISGDINDPSTFSTTIDALRAAFKPQASSLPLVFALPTIGERMVNCVPSRGLNYLVDLGYALNYIPWVVEFLAADPRIYSNTVTTATITNTTGDNTGVVNNAGTFGTYPTVVFTGPLTSARVTNNGTGEDLKFGATLTAGQTLTLDFQNRTAVKSTGADQYNTIDATIHTWFDLEPGNTTLRIRTTGFSAATKADVTFRSAWN